MKAKYKSVRGNPLARINVEFLVDSYDLKWATVNLLWLHDYDESAVTKKGIIKELRQQLHTRGDEFAILISESRLGNDELTMKDLEEMAEKIIKRLFPDFFNIKN